MDWDRINAMEKTWNEINNRMSWDEIRTLSSTGRSFDQWDWLDAAWNDKDSMLLSWDNIQQLPVSFVVYQGPGEAVSNETPTAGLSWDAMDARCLVWDEGDAEDLAWNAFEQKSNDVGPHKSCEIHIPIERRSIWIRLYAYDEAGKRTDYIATSEIPIIHVNTCDVHAVEDEACYLQADCESIQDFDGWVHTLHYNGDTLSLDSIAVAPHGFSQPRSLPSILSFFDGKLKTRNLRESGVGEQWDGVQSRANFVAEDTAETTGSLKSHHLA